MIRRKILGAALAATTLALAPASAFAGNGHGNGDHGQHGNSCGHGDNGHGHGHDQQIKHVLMLSLDGFHPFDLDNYVAAHPSSTLASLVQRGVKYSNASTVAPSDSFPGTLAMMTGGTPATTGVYYDNGYSTVLSPPGSDCSTRGTPVTYKENINFSKNSGSTAADINPDKLPRDPDNGCTPVYPHQFLKVNTIFEVAHEAGLRTAIADKHPAYEMLNGPSGVGVDDFYGPEFNSAKKDIGLIIANDELKVVAVLNQIDGLDHTGTQQVGVPAIFGMNFQTPNIAQKFSGYSDPLGLYPNDVAVIGANAGNPPGLVQALDYVDAALGRMVAELDAQGLTDSTMIIVGAKHGNSPVDVTTLRNINDETELAPLVNSFQPGLVAQLTPDTAALIWLNDKSQTDAMANFLRANASALGARRVYAGNEINTMYNGQLAGNPTRRPDVIIDTEPGVIYAGVGSKITEHGGFHAEDFEVALLVVNPGQRGGTTVRAPVSVRQIAPTVLSALGLNPRALQAVRIEHTRDLPGLRLQGDHGHGW